MVADQLAGSPHDGTSLGEALFSGTRQKVLGLLFGQPQRAFAISELIQLAGAGSGGVQREVQRLVSSGLVTVRSVGRQKQYQANPGSPIFDELSSLVRKTLGPSERLKVALEELGSSLKLAILYGSVAKQTDRADSDIDVLLVSDELTLEAVFNVVAPVEKELARPVNPTLYTSEEFEGRRKNDNSFLRKILEGKHIMLKGSLDGSTKAG